MTTPTSLRVKKVRARIMWQQDSHGGIYSTNTLGNFRPVAVIDISDMEALVEKVLSDEIRRDFKEPLKDIEARFPDAVQKYRQQVRRFLRSLGVTKGRK